MNINIKTIISHGVVYGKCEYLNSMTHSYSQYTNNKDEDIDKFNAAIKKALSDLELMKDSLDNNDKEFVDVHKMLISDPILYNEVIDNIYKGYSAEYSFITVVDSYIAKFKEAKTTYLQERILDMEDIKKRVLLSFSKKDSKKLSGEFILITDELYPSVLMDYSKEIIGVIAKRGGFTSHSAILCKSREIPYILVDDFNNLDGNIMIDTRKNLILLNPTIIDIEEYNAIKKSKDSFMIDSFDGVNILANVTSNMDLANVNKYNMDGVGLYRTELIFMNVDRAMTYDEQYKIYSEAVRAMGSKSIVFRTFDIGDDKQLSYIKTFKKGILNYKNNPEVFETQVKALIKANLYNNIKIMFPMIEDYSEYLYLRDWVYKIQKDMNDTSTLKIGMMLETKKALENIKDFKDVDFISLGTNDLTSELFNISREDTLNYKSFIVELIKSLEAVVTHCNDNNIYLSICGELAGIKNVVKRLYKIGIRNYSVSVANVRNLNQALVEELK